jgi:hypothetical protein
MRKHYKYLRVLAVNAVYILTFVLCRYVLFSLHGMKQWPFILFVLGMVFLNVSLIFNLKIVVYSSLLSYITGFLIGYLFQFDYEDIGGGRLNSLWIIWTVTMVSIVVMGITVEIIRRFMKYKNSNGTNPPLNKSNW